MDLHSKFGDILRLSHMKDNVLQTDDYAEVRRIFDAYYPPDYEFLEKQKQRLNTSLSVAASLSVSDFYQSIYADLIRNETIPQRITEYKTVNVHDSFRSSYMYGHIYVLRYADQVKLEWSVKHDSRIMNPLLAAHWRVLYDFNSVLPKIIRKLTDMYAVFTRTITLNETGSTEWLELQYDMLVGVLYVMLHDHYMIYPILTDAQRTYYRKIGDEELIGSDTGVDISRLESASKKENEIIVPCVPVRSISDESLLSSLTPPIR